MPRTHDNDAPTPEAPPSVVARFEHALDELEQLVQKMEKGEQTLDESLAAYERGIALYRQCQSALEQAELRVKLLSDPQRPASAVDFPTGDAG
jgi:exodeoxyribonuclease VII small subunit